MFLVVGAEGQLGQVFAKHLGDKAVYCTVSDCNITNLAEVKATFSKYKPEVVINCAAYTNVDKAEAEDREICFKVNVDGVKNLAIACNEIDASLIHISTDYIFDGQKTFPYTEDDKTGAINEYGKSKEEAEKVFDELVNKGAIFRASYLYSEFGNNIVKLFKKLLTEREAINTVTDQKVTMTNADRLVEAVIAFIESGAKKEIYNLSSSNELSFYDLAIEMQNILASKCQINPIEYKDYPSKIARPKYSVLDSSKAARELKVELQTWQEGISECLKNL